MERTKKIFGFITAALAFTSLFSAREWMLTIKNSDTYNSVFNSETYQDYIKAMAILKSGNGVLSVGKSLEAFSYMKKSADKGYGKALFRLSRMYCGGYGVEKNIENAKIAMWKSYKSGIKDAEPFVNDPCQLR